MPPEDFLEQLRYNLHVNSSFVMRRGDVSYYAQWRQTKEELAVASWSADPVYDEPTGNPSAVWLATCSGAGQQLCRVLIAEYAEDRPAAWGTNKSLALCLAEHDILIDAGSTVEGWTFPSAAPRDLLCWAGEGPRLLPCEEGRLAPLDGPIKVQWWKAVTLGSLAPDFRKWLSRIWLWQADVSDTSARRLFTLASNLYYETRSPIRGLLRHSLDRFRTVSLRSNLRLLYGESAQAWRRTRAALSRRRANQ
jgi:hypothetical protein